MLLHMLKRTQILLTADQLQRVRREAKKRRGSVGSVVREAIDRVYPPERIGRRAALERILAGPEIPFGEWEDVKRDLPRIIERSALR